VPRYFNQPRAQIDRSFFVTAVSDLNFIFYVIAPLTMKRISVIKDVYNVEKYPKHKMLNLTSRMWKSTLAAKNCYLFKRYAEFFEGIPHKAGSF
jgi:hypothetical protein